MCVLPLVYKYVHIHAWWVMLIICRTHDALTAGHLEYTETRVMFWVGIHLENVILF